MLNGDPADRLPGNAHFSFPGCEGDALLLLLDAPDIACSTGSACSAGIAQPSHVLLAMGADDAVARSTLRFTLGHTSTDDDVRALVAALPAAVERARAGRAGPGRPWEVATLWGWVRGCWPPCRAASTRRSRPPGRSTPGTT